MNKRIKKIVSIGITAVLTVTCLGGCSENSVTVNKEYIPSDESVALMTVDNCQLLLSNPDRGLRTETYITLGSPLYSYPLNEEDPFERAQDIIDKYKEDSPTVCQLYVYLSNYCDKDLDEIAFSQLEKIFEIFRSNGIRLLLRFTYSTESVPDAPYRIVKKHLAQIDGWFKENEELVNDTLYCLQTGIIGYWGEGHSYQKLKSRHIKKVIRDVSEIAPEGIYTQVRTYKMLSLVSDKYEDTVGIHDDYIIGDMNHQWSFIPQSSQKKFNETVNRARFTVNDGEMPWGRATLDDKEGAEPLNSLDGKKILQQLSTYSMTSFSLEHNYREDGNEYSMAKWKNEFMSYDEVTSLGITANPMLFKNSEGEDVKISVYDMIRYHLGYQLVLSNYTSEDGKASFTVTNYGFAPPLNFNYFAAVLKDKNSGKLSEQKIESYNKNLLLSGTSVRYTVSVPEGYELIGVKMDTFKGRGINPRFANDTSFIDGVQYFY